MSIEATTPIAELQRRLKAAPLLSAESFDLQDQVINAVIADLEAVLAEGQMPVYRITEELYVAVHPSAKQEGMLQATHYSTGGLFSDSQHQTAKELVSHEGLWFRKRLTDDEAAAVIRQSIVAESAFQARHKAKGMSL